MNRDERSLLERTPIYEMQAIMVLAAALLVEADGYDTGDEVDLPEQMLLWVVAELVRRMKTREEATPRESDGMIERPEQERRAVTRLVFAYYEMLQPLENSTPLAYYKQGYRMTAVFQDLRKLSDDQLVAVIAHAFLCLATFLVEVYDFPPFFDKQRSLYEIMMGWSATAAAERKDEMYRIREVIPVVRDFATQVGQSSLTEGYAPEFLFAN